MKNIIISLLFIILITQIPCSALSDDFDILRERWVDTLTGGDYPVTGALYTDYIKPKVDSVTATASSQWNSMLKAGQRVNDYTGSNSCLWTSARPGDTRYNDQRNSAAMNSTYLRLFNLAMAYKTKGSSLYGNQNMLADIISALDWLYIYKFNESTPKSTRVYLEDNWYNWELSVPRHLNNIQALLYDELSPAQIANYQKAIDKQLPSLSAGYTGANRTEGAKLLAVGGIVKKDAAKLTASRDAISPTLAYVTTDDGFYADGSFIQHHTVPYNGAYGLTALNDLSGIMRLFESSPWEITDQNKSNLYDWVENAFIPLMYEGRTMDMVTGRSISREGGNYNFLAILTNIASFAPTQRAAYYKTVIKRWAVNNPSMNYYGSFSDIYTITRFNQIMSDPLISPAPAPILYKQYPSMDRFARFGNGFAFGASMYSTRITNYELINEENLRGWHTGSGMTYLYNDDLSHYDDGYWATVNSRRLPGTTVVKNSDAPAGQRGQSFAGGAEIMGLYGVSGFYYKAGADNSGKSHNLEAKKSWFMFGDAVVALGAGITSSTEGDSVETIVENRKITNNNPLTVNGITKSASIGWTERMSGVRWAHLAGNPSTSLNGANTDIGYYFPETADINGLRESRTDSWSSVNKLENKTALITKNYLSLAIDHTAAPNEQKYSYVLLPGKTAAQVESYSQNPNIEILANNSDVQAVCETTENIFGANFWNNKSVTVGGITVKNKASVMIAETDETIEISVSDPTRENRGTIELSLDEVLGDIASRDGNIAVTRGASSTTVYVNVNGLPGTSSKIIFYKEPQSAGEETDEIKAIKADLKAIIDANADKIENDFTAKSWGAFSGALIAASDIFSNYTGGGVIVFSDACIALKNAVNNLVKTADSIEKSAVLTKDAYVDNNSAYRSVNMGADARLAVKNTVADRSVSTNRWAYLGFDISDITNNAIDVKLNLYIYGTGTINTTVYVHSCSNSSWAENGITYNNQPYGNINQTFLYSKYIGSITSLNQGWVEFDVNDYVKAQKNAGAGAVTFVVSATSTTNAGSVFVEIPSKENTSAEYQGKQARLGGKVEKTLSDLKNADLAALDINDYINDINASSITSDLKALPSEGTVNNYPVTWKSSEPNIISGGGKIISRPYHDTELTLTALIETDGVVHARDFALTVKARDISADKPFIYQILSGIKTPLTKDYILDVNLPLKSDVKIRNISDSACDVYIALAVYTPDGKLSDLSIETSAVSAGAVYERTISVENLSQAWYPAGTLVKSLIWSSDSLTPLGEYVD